MLTNLFESRNKTFLNLVKLGDFLGRSLRENVELFNVEDSLATYLTESGAVIQGNFDSKALKLTDVQVRDASIFEDKEIYSKLVDNKVNNFLADIISNDLDTVNESFDSILNLWESRLKFDHTKSRLASKVERFDETAQIVSTEEFSRVVEIKDDLVAMLKESQNFINIPEIRNTIKLSSVISKSFNLPKLTYEKLAEDKVYQIPSTINHTLYDHLCKHELITKELAEAKTKFETVWVTNEKVQKLPTSIYESDNKIAALVAEIIVDVPYFAMATKKQISSLVENNLDLLVDTKAVPEKDIKSFVSKIYEFKKPVKDYVVNLLNEKYGVNVQTLTDVPTFDSLVKTHVVIFESLARLSPKSSVMKKVLGDFADTLKIKNGIEAIDVSDFLESVFDECEYNSILNETSLMNYLNFEKVADDLGKIGQVLKMIQSGMGGGAAGGLAAALGGGQGAQGAAAPAANAMASQMPQGEGQAEADGGDESAGMIPDEEMPNEDGEAGDTMPAMDSEDAAAEAGEEVDAEQEGQEGIAGGMYDDEVEMTSKDELIDNMRELEELISMLKSDMGVEGEEGEMEGEGMEGEEDMPMGDGDGDEMPEINTGDGDDEVHIDTDSHNNEGEGEEEDMGDEEEDEPPAKPKKKKGKSED